MINISIMKKLIYGGLFLATVGMVIVGCKKEDSNILNRSQKNTASFNSEEEFRTKLTELQGMSEENRRAYEKQSNLKSLFTQVFEIYEEIDMENLTDKEILYNHVEKNQDFLQIVKNIQGEMEFKPFYSDNPYSMIASENRMIIVGEKCIKVFDDGLVSAPISMFNELVAVNNKFTSDVLKKEGFEVTTIKFEDVSTKASCPTQAETRADNGRNRTLLRIGINLALVNTSSGQTWASHSWIEVRPYMKTLGIWYYAQRTISGNLTATIGYNDGNGMPQSHTINRTIYPSLSYVESINHYEPIPGNPSYVHFKKYSALGTTPSTGNATLTCN